MRPLNLTTPGYVEEVIIDVFEEDERFTRLTVIDSEETPVAVTLNVTELIEIRDWINSRLNQLQQTNPETSEVLHANY
jgi:hypothetical protein